MTTPGALDGIVVADFTRVLAGPYATMMLADFGAEVIKIEHPDGGDDTRSWGPPFDAFGQSTYFDSVNRNKRSVTIDLRTEAGRAEALDIVGHADVVIENFRTGTMERLGLGYDTVAALKPGIVYCAITGFGSGAGADLPGYDLLVQAVGGLMSVTGPGPGEPTKVGVAVVDVLTGLHALAAVLAALRHRERTGEGQKIETNLLSCLLSSMVNQVSGYLGAGVVPGILGNRHPSVTPYEVFETADRPIAVAVGNAKQFEALALALGCPELSSDARFSDNAARIANRLALHEAVADRLLRRTADEWFEVLTQAHVPVGPINDIAHAVALAQRLGLAPAVPLPGGAAPTVANPITMSATPPRYVSAPPALGSGNGRRSGVDIASVTE